MKLHPPSAGESVLVLAVHPDDESLGAGGLIQLAVAARAEVRVVFITDGDNNPWPQRFVERRWRIDCAARKRWGERRQGEARAALACLGVPPENIFFWHYLDQGLTRLLLDGGGEFIARLAATILRWTPDLLVAPSPRDLHPDHSACAVMLNFALAGKALPPARRGRLLEYLVHSRETAPPRGTVEIDLLPGQVERKRQAILRHTTQMALSRERFLAFAQASEVFLLPAPAASFQSAHPVFSAELSRGVLRLRVKRGRSPSTLLLVAETPDGGVRQTLKISRAANSPDQDELLLPVPSLAAAHGLFVKLVVGRGFFDRAGWRQIPLPSDPRAVALRVCCVIPCYDLAGICGPIVQAAAGFVDKVIAVNDGSKDGTEQVLRAVAERCHGRVEVLNFPANCGKGVALLQAFRRAAETGAFDIVVTVDGDGQHRPEDIPRLVRAIVDGEHAMVIGERLARARMPLRSRLGNTFTATVMKLLYPAAPTDTQSGFRALRGDFVREIVTTIEGGRYETELQMLLLALHRGHRIGSVTIPTLYLDENRLSHFRPIRDSWRIYRTLLRWQFRAPSHDRSAPRDWVNSTRRALATAGRVGSAWSSYRSQ